MGEPEREKAAIGQGRDVATGRFVPGYVGGPGRRPKPQLIRDFDARARRHCATPEFWQRFLEELRRLRPKDRVQVKMWLVERAFGKARQPVEGQVSVPELEALAQAVQVASMVRAMSSAQYARLMATLESRVALPTGGNGSGDVGGSGDDDDAGAAPQVG